MQTGLEFKSKDGTLFIQVHVDEQDAGSGWKQWLTALPYNGGENMFLGGLTETISRMNCRQRSTEQSGLALAPPKNMLQQAGLSP